MQSLDVVEVIFNFYKMTSLSAMGGETLFFCLKMTVIKVLKEIKIHSIKWMCIQISGTHSSPQILAFI